MTGPNPLPRTVLTGAYAVIFISQRVISDGQHSGQDSYGQTADRMVELAAQQPGYIGIRSARGADGLGITVSYWRSQEEIAAWRAQAEHSLARQHGREHWYEHYELQIAKIERAYDWQREH